MAVVATLALTVWPTLDGPPPSGPIRQVFRVGDSHFMLAADLGTATVGAEDGCLVLRTFRGTYVPTFSTPVVIVEDGHAIEVHSVVAGLQTIRLGDRVRLGGGVVGDPADTYAATGCQAGPLAVGDVAVEFSPWRRGAPPDSGGSGFTLN